MSLNYARFEGHTPGPWQILWANDGAYKLIGPQKRVLATWTDRIRPVTVNEFKANANLIVSAPELLAENELLRNALVAIRDKPVFDQWAEDDNSWLTNAVDTMQQIASNALKERINND